MDSGVTQWPANIGIFVMYPAMPIAALRGVGQDGSHFLIGRVVAEGGGMVRRVDFAIHIAVIHNLSP